jgi:hypothetical protein
VLAGVSGTSALYCAKDRSPAATAKHALPYPEIDGISAAVSRGGSMGSATTSGTRRADHIGVPRDARVRELFDEVENDVIASTAAATTQRTATVARTSQPKALHCNARCLR